MGHLETKDGYNMYDMLSLMQKAIRRGRFNDAGFAAYQLSFIFRKVMWNRLLVISSEDCYGVLTKEIVRLMKADEEEKDNANISKAVALMCRALKSRDACYFSCNFVLVPVKTRDIEVTDGEVSELKTFIASRMNAVMEKEYDEFGFQTSLIGNEEERQRIEFAAREGAILIKAIEHLDMSMAGYQMDKLRKDYREELWCIFNGCANKINERLKYEIDALRIADDTVNHNKKDKDEIFISKAVMELCYYQYGKRPLEATEIIQLSPSFIDWDKYKIKDIEDCELVNNKVPEWTYDCHTIKGKRMGKTDWDMTVDEQAGLYPKMDDFFGEASWLPIYEDDLKNGLMTEKQIAPIREFAKTHKDNPIEVIPYE